MFYSTLNGKQLIKFRNPFFHNRLAPPTRPMLPVRPQPALCPPHPSASAAVFPNRQSVLRRCANRHRPLLPPREPPLRAVHAATRTLRHVPPARVPLEVVAPIRGPTSFGYRVHACPLVVAAAASRLVHGQGAS
jgi:hypothetical protein